MKKTKDENCSVHSYRWPIVQEVILNTYLRCLILKEAEYIMQEVHKGICSNHFRTQAITHKLVQSRYFQPIIRENVEEIVRKYDKFQRFTNMLRPLASELKHQSSHWSFTQWGLDALGPFLPSLEQRKFLIVEINYFTKWVEAETLAMITK